MLFIILRAIPPLSNKIFFYRPASAIFLLIITNELINLVYILVLI